MIILPGGAILENYANHKQLSSVLTNKINNNQKVSAICAAPLFLYELGLLNNRKITCYPAVKNKMPNANTSDEGVVVDGNIITSKAAGTTIDFALEIVKSLLGENVSNKVKEEIYYN